MQARGPTSSAHDKTLTPDTNAPAEKKSVAARAKSLLSTSGYTPNTSAMNGTRTCSIQSSGNRGSSMSGSARQLPCDLLHVHTCTGQGTIECTPANMAKRTRQDNDHHSMLHDCHACITRLLGLTWHTTRFAVAAAAAAATLLLCCG